MNHSQAILSIITVNYNNESGLSRTLESISAQSKISDVEHIIIDGASTDQSLEIIQAYQNTSMHPVKISSEPDDGIYHAMNKGLDLATGRYVAFLNSGDILVKKDLLEILLSNLESDKDLDLLYGDLYFKGANPNITRFWSTGYFSKYKLWLGWHLPHPMTVLKLDTIRLLGNFNQQYSIAADYHLLLKYLFRPNIKYIYLQMPFVDMQPGGASNGSLRNIIFANVEVVRAWQDVTPHVRPIWLILTKPLSKILQLLKAKFSRFVTCFL